MSIVNISPSGQGLGADLKGLMAALLSGNMADALMLPLRGPDGKTVLPALVASEQALDLAVLTDPSFAVNAARMASRLSVRPAGKTTFLWLRPCEVRAVRELVKINQVDLNELVIMGTDCPMAVDDTHGAVTDPDRWAGTVFPDPQGLRDAGQSVSSACSICASPFAGEVDLAFLFYGRNPDEGILIEGRTPRGEAVLDDLVQAGAAAAGGRIPDERDAVKTRVAQAASDAFAALEETMRQVNSPDKMGQFFGACINCYNCRTVCPVCYCRECVFNTDVFSHDPHLYHQWATKEGQVRLPSDTLFYHLTRMVHMSHACVGCGQCTRACPAGIAVSDLFTCVAREVQDAFGYVPGGDDPPPQSVFGRDEFPEVVGIE